MKQMSLARGGFDRYGKMTKRAAFLAEMERVIPWTELCALVDPHYPKPGKGRPPVGLERMLRIHFLQHWFNLSDPGVEEALYESVSMREFVGIDLGREPVPDETTVLNFRHLLERHELGRQIFERVGLHLQDNGFKLSTGTIVDATLIAAPSSTKNAKRERDPEMKQSKKGNQWYFGMKAHVGVDAKTKLIHRVVTTSGAVHDGKVLPQLLHGKETAVWGDAAYTGQTEVIGQHAPWAQDLTQRRGRGYKYLSQMQRAINRKRSQVRARAEHAIGTIKRIFGFTKVRYRGLAKNGNRLFVAAALANLYMVRGALKA
ncbi:MAG: IS5 family transposase [Rhodoferax sp.]|nr:IS5 family transposase [Rhodoferax sp.]